MSRTIQFAEAEIAEVVDFDAISLHAREGDEEIVGGAIDYPHHWADIAIATTSAIELTLSAGSLFAGDLVYANQTPTVVDLQVHLPLVAGDRRFVALLMRGVEETKPALRMVETDVDTAATVQMSVPKTGVRRWEVVIQQGLSSPTPIRPSIAATECCLAFVELATTGILAVELDHASRVKTLAEVEGRVGLLEGSVTATTRRVSTIETDVANIASRLGEIPSPIVIRQLKRDVAILRRSIAMPEETRAYWYDAGLLTDAWETADPSWLARIREGVRFPWAAERDARLALLDPASAAIRMSGTLMLPAWSESPRIVVEGDGSSVNISQIVHTVVNAVRREISRTVTEYGATVSVCENNAEWSMTGGLAVGALFTAAGETFEVVSIDGGSRGHVFRGIRQIVTYTVADVYWEHVTETIGVNGAVYGQTFLCAQPMIVTSIDLSFTRVGSDGDVHLFVCECDETGRPQFGSVIVHTSRSRAELATGWVGFSFRPSLLESGRRYAWFTVTTGNHALETVAGNKYAQGSRFTATDGAWAQGSTDVDFAMRINAARFEATRTVVEFDPLTLENGMTELRLLTAGWASGGTSLVWEIRPSTRDDWQPLTFAAIGEENALAGLPALVRLRAVMVGTTDLQPALVLDAKARGLTFRPRGEMVAVSRLQAFGLATTTIQEEIVVDAFDPEKHTISPKLVVGGAVLSPSATVITPDLVNPEKRTILATFTLAEAATWARARVDLTTTEVTDVPFVQNIALYAL